MKVVRTERVKDEANKMRCKWSNYGYGCSSWAFRRLMKTKVMMSLPIGTTLLTTHSCYHGNNVDRLPW